MHSSAAKATVTSHDISINNLMLLDYHRHI